MSDPVSAGLGPAGPSPADPNDGELARELHARLRKQREPMADLLSELAAAESPSEDPEAQEGVRTMLTGLLESVGLEVERLAGEGVGDHLLASRPGTNPGAPLVIGHLDTVWPLGTIKQMPVRRLGERLHGPGVYDMKGGLVQLIFALQELEGLGAAPPVTVLICADEEIGSPDSRRHLEVLAPQASCALVLEPSFGPGGSLKTARKGVGRFRISISGRASHAGIEPERGVSAILELSRQVQGLFALNDPGAGLTVNVGTIDGGLGANVIAPEASAMVEARAPTTAQASAVTDAIERLAPSQPGCTINVEGGFGRPPLERTERNRELWARAMASADLLGIKISEAAVGGASDGNLASAHTATLDGLGAVGDGAHAPEEHVIVDLMPERASLLGVLLLGDASARGER